MKNKCLNHKKLNNKGLTLVEVIVAVAILSFAILPLMYTFVYTSRFNAKSREQQRATSAAEAILENYKAFPLTDINNAFSSNNFTVGDAGAMGTDVLYSTDLGSTPSKYIIRNMNFEKAGASNTQYDALITVNTHNSDPLYSGNLFELNNTDNYVDAIYKGVDGLDETAYNEAKNTIQAEWNTKSKHTTVSPVFPEDKIEFKRELTLTITKSGTGVYKVTPTLNYTYRVATFNYKQSDGNLVQFNRYNGGETIDKSSEVPVLEMEGTLDRLFVYYFPLYTVSSGDKWIDGDTINIVNTTSDIIDVYIYKQRSVGRTPLQTYTLEATVDNMERTKIYIKQGAVNIYHNLLVNIGEASAGAGMSANGATISNILHSSGGTFTDKTSVTPTPIPTADILSDINVKIYAKGSLDASGNELAGARVLAEIGSTFNGK